jgi:CheY-like chemotaxis protein
LAIARHIAQAHGGSIEVESEGEGKGATFSVRLPIGEADLACSDAASAPVGFSATDDQRLNGVTALVVDDELDTRDVLTYALQAAGVEVLAVPSAESALEILNRRRPNVILSDLQMPEMDGFALLRAVQERLGTLSPPTIAITARAKINDTERVARAGFAAHVAKPVDLNLLLATIRTVTASRTT